MKKYWPVICLSVLSMVGLSIYYINNVTANNIVRPFTFETIEGDASQLQNVKFETNYYDDHIYENYIVSADGIERLQNGLEFQYEYNYSIGQLIKEHKSFFRAKRLESNHYFNDDDSLVYVHIDDEYHNDHPTQALYEVDRLHKETGEREKVDFTVDVDGDYAWQTVEWVSNTNNELQVLSIRTERNLKEQVVLTTFDFETEAATEKVLVDYIDNHAIAFISHNNYINSGKDIVFSQFGNSESNNHEPKKLYHYNVERGLQEIQSQSKEGFLYDQYTMNGQYLVESSYSKNEVAINLYNLQSSKWEQEFSIELSLQPKDSAARVYLLNDRLFVLYDVGEGYAIEIVDRTNGAKLYAGLLTITDVTHDHYITIYNVFEKQ